MTFGPAQLTATSNRPNRAMARFGRFTHIFLAANAGTDEFGLGAELAQYGGQFLPGFFIRPETTMEPPSAAKTKLPPGLSRSARP
jgi:hypothetical protein